LSPASEGQKVRQLRELEQRFGFGPDVFSRLGLEQAQSALFVATKEVIRFDRVRTLRKGMRLCRQFPRTVKPTTSAMQILGHKATRNCVTVSEEQARRLVNGDAVQIQAEVEDGFVIVLWGGFVVGVGQYRRPRLSSCIPRYRPVD